MPPISDKFHARLSSRLRDAAAFAQCHRSSSSVRLYFKAKSKALAESAGLSLQEICAAIERALGKQNGVHEITRQAHDRVYGSIDGFAEVLATAERLLRPDGLDYFTAFDLITPSFDGLKVEVSIRSKRAQSLRDAFSETHPLRYYFDGKAAGFKKDGACSKEKLSALCSGYRRDAYRCRRNSARRHYLLGLAAAELEVIAIVQRDEALRRDGAHSGG